jgi:hypothetical protein
MKDKAFAELLAGVSPDLGSGAVDGLLGSYEDSAKVSSSPAQSDSSRLAYYVG